MDTKLIKNQISYWEGVLKEGEKQVKVQQEQNATIKATIKNLKALLPKEQTIEERQAFVEETQPS